MAGDEFYHIYKIENYIYDKIENYIYLFINLYLLKMPINVEDYLANRDAAMEKECRKVQARNFLENYYSLLKDKIEMLQQPDPPAFFDGSSLISVGCKNNLITIHTKDHKINDLSPEEAYEILNRLIE